MQDQHHHQSLIAAAAAAAGFPQVNVQFPEHEQLRCPRCDSSNTKFCYYNNYNLSQPRHFCKSCKRYWTKGGTLRNIPVGGGCRKSNKRPAPDAAAAAPAPAVKQQQHQQRVVQFPSASITTPAPAASSGSGSAVVLSQNPTLKVEPGPSPGPVLDPGVGPGSGGAGESFTSLLGMASKGQFGTFVEGFGPSGAKIGPGQNTGFEGLDQTGTKFESGQNTGLEGFMISEGSCWGSYSNGWPDLVINTNPGSKLQ